MICNFCNEKIDDGSFFCNKCGAKLPVIETQNIIVENVVNNKKLKIKRKNKKVISVILLVLAIVCGIVSYQTVNTDEYEDIAYIYYYNEALAEGYLETAEEFSGEKYLVQAFLNLAEKAQETADMYAGYIATHHIVNIVFGLFSIVLLILSIIFLILGIKKEKKKSDKSGSSMQTPLDNRILLCADKGD